VTFDHVVLCVQAVASSAMCGLIWFVQIVHYPLFGLVDGERSKAFAQVHQDRTARVVIPFMLAEGAAAVYLAAWPPAGVPRPVTILGAAIVVAIWLSTAALQMPLHRRLAKEGNTVDAVAALVRSNWLRTAAWSLRAALSVWMLRVSAG
jgi:L-asparagine transporter-like permease